MIEVSFYILTCSILMETGTLEYPRAYSSATCIWVMHVASIGSLDFSPVVGKNDSSLPASITALFVGDRLPFVG